MYGPLTSENHIETALLSDSKRKALKQNLMKKIYKTIFKKVGRKGFGCEYCNRKFVIENCLSVHMC